MKKAFHYYKRIDCTDNFLESLIKHLKKCKVFFIIIIFYLFLHLKNDSQQFSHNIFSYLIKKICKNFSLAFKKMRVKQVLLK